MVFNNEIQELQPGNNKKIQLIGAKLPTRSADIYFRAKREELIAQYYGARIFLRETETPDWPHWFEHTGDGDVAAFASAMYKEYFYEIALIYYNIIVDLSWTMCYSAAESEIEGKHGKKFDFGGLATIEEAYQLLRTAESNVTNPTAKSNPFGDLKARSPQFGKAIDMVVDFWKSFKEDPIRIKYNFIKHRGKLKDIREQEARGSRIFEMSFVTKERTIQLPTDVRDVQYTHNVEESIAELIKFDNERLFPYISALIYEIEAVLNPSEFI